MVIRRVSDDCYLVMLVLNEGGIIFWVSWATLNAPPSSTKQIYLLLLELAVFAAKVSLQLRPTDFIFILFILWVKVFFLIIFW